MVRCFQHAAASGTESGGGGQSLSSSGSCLKDFRTIPFVECNGKGNCQNFPREFSFWMAVIEDSEQFQKPKSQTLQDGNSQSKRVSRCQVCIDWGIYDLLM